MNRLRNRLGVGTLLWAAGILLCFSKGAEDIVKVENISSQPCWVLGNDVVEMAVTQLGAQMAPVTFCRNENQPVKPYYLSPWQDEGLKLEPPVLVPLRGDFFSLPFGSNPDPYNGQRYLPHGEPPNTQWTCIGSAKKGAVTTLTLELRTQNPPGKITKRIYLVDGHNAVYSQERLDEYATKTSIGHHAILAVPETEGALRIATSRIRFGMTSPLLFSDPTNREYQSFAIGKKFDDLRRVPLMWKDAEPADCTSYPARKGFADLLAVFSETGSKLERNVAWTTAVNEEGGYLWFSMRDPDILPATVFWIENHGRHGVPWNGRNSCLGLEDACSYLNEGMPVSAEPNPVNQMGIPTSIELSPDQPTVVNYIQGAVKIPADFLRVKEVRFGKGVVTFVSVTEKTVTIPLYSEFIRTGNL